MPSSEEIIKKAADNASGASIPSFSSNTVLLVEDDYSIRRYLEVVLQRAGYEVVTASDGLGAMKSALSNSIDVVITDAIMPHLNGYELCRFLRRHPKLSQIPVVMLSGLEHSAPKIDDKDRADVYLAKPVRPEELTVCLKELLAHPVEYLKTA
jgi:DNA-binding response OmpR family regulator